MTPVYAALAWCCLAYMSGCVSSPPPHIYVLRSARNVEDVTAAQRVDRIGLATIAIPDYLHSTDIVTRTGEHELVSSTTGRWGERLDVGLRDALASDLSARLPITFVTTTRDIDASVRRLLVTVSTLDVWADGRCILVASWSISGGSAALEFLSENTFRVDSGTWTGSRSDSQVVASIVAAVAMLADRIAASLVEQPHPPFATAGH